MSTPFEKYTNFIKSLNTDELWELLEIIDKKFSLSAFVIIANQIVKNEQIDNFQDLEKSFRSKNFNTHLFAMIPSQMSDNVKVVSPFLNSPRKFECYYSCRPYSQALSEVIKTNGSYELNFHMLSDSGVLMVDDIDEFIESDIPQNKHGVHSDEITILK